MTFEPSPTAREMAEALRAGMSARLRDFDAATPDQDLARLHALGAIEDVPAVAKPTAWSALVRGTRRLLLGLMRPWLAAQTAFNRAIAEQAVGTSLTTNDLSRRVVELERSIDLLREDARRPERVTPGAGVPAPRLDRDTLLRLIVQSRIRRPPARVLVCGSASIAQDLVAFGYDVVTDCAHHPDAVASFDVAVWLPGSRQADEERASGWAAATARPLRGGAQAIVVCESHQAAAAADVFDITEQILVREDDRGWTIVEEPAPAGDVRRETTPREISVIVAKRPHAADR